MTEKQLLVRLVEKINISGKFLLKYRFEEQCSGLLLKPHYLITPTPAN